MAEQATAATKASRKSLKCAAKGWRFIQDDFAQGHDHKAAGKPVVWSCALVEKEIYHSMGLHAFYPEQYASLSAVWRKSPDAEKDAVRFARIAEQHGYSTDLCGYHRAVMGYVINGDLADGALGGMAAPDLLITTSSVCDLRMKWWEDLAQRLRVPMFILDRPERIIRQRLETPKPYEIEYYRSQLEDCFSFISDVTGNRYDQDRLNHCLDWAYRTNEVRLEIMELRKAVPSPMGSGDGFSCVYPGTVAAQRFTWQGMVKGQPVITVAVNWLMGEKDLDPPWKLDGERFEVEVQGDPSVLVTFRGLQPVFEKADLKRNPGIVATAMNCVNSIPYVCAAPAGIRTYLDLPLVAGRADAGLRG